MNLIRSYLLFDFPFGSNDQAVCIYLEYITLRVELTFKTKATLCLKLQIQPSSYMYFVGPKRIKLGLPSQAFETEKVLLSFFFLLRLLRVHCCAGEIASYLFIV